MRILFVSPNSFPPQFYGGIETATLDLCAGLRDQGHETAVMAGLAYGDALWLKNRIKSRIFKQSFPKDQVSGTTIFRGYNLDRRLAAVAAAWHPDVVVVQARDASSAEVAVASLKLGLSTAYYVHDVKVFRDTVPSSSTKDLIWIANSTFTAREIHKALDINAEIVPVLVREELYKTNPDRQFVTMINPQRIKGGHIAMAVARLCPDIPFLFIEAWKDYHLEVKDLKSTSAKLNNATWLASQKDMRAIYSKTKVLFAPSQCEETWVRVVTEAQFSGIPALASKIGALAETVGPGGLLLEPDAESSQWAESLRSLWDNAETYQHYSNAALHHSARAEMSPQEIVSKFIQVLERQITSTI